MHKHFATPLEESERLDPYYTQKPTSLCNETKLPRHLGGNELVVIGRQLDNQTGNLTFFFHKLAGSLSLNRAICQATLLHSRE